MNKQQRPTQCKHQPERQSTMQQAAIADPQDSGIDPDTACISCGQDSTPETMVICDSCEQGFHTACFGMPAVPDASPWHCVGCSSLQQLAAGHQIVTESPQDLYPGGAAVQPHHTQGLHQATIISLGPMQQDAAGRIRQARVLSSRTPLPGYVRFYSKMAPYTPLALQRAPQQSQQLSEQLLQHFGVSEMSITLASSRFGMFGSAAAAAGLASEAGLAGTNCCAAAMGVLAGPPKQAFIWGCSKRLPLQHLAQAATTPHPSSSQTLQHLHLPAPAWHML